MSKLTESVWPNATSRGRGSGMVGGGGGQGEGDTPHS